MPQFLRATRAREAISLLDKDTLLFVLMVYSTKKESSGLERAVSVFVFICIQNNSVLVLNFGLPVVHLEKLKHRDPMQEYSYLNLKKINLWISYISPVIDSSPLISCKW